MRMKYSVRTATDQCLVSIIITGPVLGIPNVESAKDTKYTANNGIDPRPINQSITAEKEGHKGA